MDTELKQEFYDEFIKLYLITGFANTPKKEVDLFVFNFLTNTPDYSNKTNYELANAFKITETRIKSLRLNAALRYGKPSPSYTLATVVKRLIDPSPPLNISNGKFELLLENPVEKWELENFLKQHKRPAEYTLNSEVLRITPQMLLELIVKEGKLTRKQLNTIISACVSDGHLDKKIIDEAETLEQFFNKLRTKFFSVETLVPMVLSAAKIYVKSIMP